MLKRGDLNKYFLLLLIFVYMFVGFWGILVRNVLSLDSRHLKYWFLTFHLRSKEFCHNSTGV